MLTIAVGEYFARIMRSTPSRSASRSCCRLKAGRASLSATSAPSCAWLTVLASLFVTVLDLLCSALSRMAISWSAWPR